MFSGQLFCICARPFPLASSISIHRNTQAGWVRLDLAAIGLDDSQAYQVHDLLGAGHYLWQGARNYVALTPESLPAHIFRVRRWVRTERDFDYYL